MYVGIFIGSLFFNFNVHSMLNFEKATCLFGCVFINIVQCLLEEGRRLIQTIFIT